jgi:hypothetical protein
MEKSCKTQGFPMASDVYNPVYLGCLAPRAGNTATLTIARDLNI